MVEALRSSDTPSEDAQRRGRNKPADWTSRHNNTQPIQTPHERAWEEGASSITYSYINYDDARRIACSIEAASLD